MKLFFLILCMATLSCHAGLIKVGKQQRFQTISGALNAATPGDTILVEKGLYKEGNLGITIPVVLIGTDYPVLDGELKHEIISIRSPYVTIEGFDLRNTAVSSMTDYAAIKIYNTHHISITRNIIRDAFFGIYAQEASSCLIENNILTAHHLEEQQSGNGIHCWKSDSMRILGNRISGHRDGIYFEFVTRSIIWRNVSFNNLRYGLHFMFSNNDAYIMNVFKNNGAGVAVMFSEGVTMIRNHFMENWGDASYGLLLKEIRDSHVENNYFTANTTGIYAEGATRINMKHNSFTANGWALKIQASCMEIVLEKNNFQGNSFDVGTNGSLVLNTFTHNYWDKYSGYDLDKNKVGDMPYRPVSLFGMIVEQNPPAMILFRSLITSLMDRSEKVLPALTPENLKDDFPLMKPLAL